MSVMEAVAEAARRALTDPRRAAEDFLNGLEDPAGDLVLQFIDPPEGFAHWSLGKIHDYETTGAPVLIRGRWGEIWLCPADTVYYQNLEPRAPVVTPRGLQALGRGIIDVLTSHDISVVPDGLYPWEASA